MYILGINAFHGDSSACIFQDDRFIAALEEERLTRIKHWAGLPVQAIRFCLSEAGCTLGDVDYIAVSRDPKANFSNKMFYAVRNIAGWGNAVNRLKNSRRVSSISHQLEDAFQIGRGELAQKVVMVEHHRSHLACGFFASPYAASALLSVDGFGDFSSTMRGVGNGSEIRILDQVTYPHSMGIYYSALTQFLGFENYGDEYKVMGLAPYGNPVYVNKLHEVVRTLDNGLFALNLDYFIHPKRGVKMQWNGGYPEIDRLYSPALEKLLGPARRKDEELTQYHKDLAASIQKTYEEVLFHMLNDLHRKTGLECVCIAGGCAQNSVANGKIRLNTPFRHIYIPSAGHDAGTCMGAALYVNHQILHKKRIKPLMHGYWGSRFSDQEIIRFLTETQVPFRHIENDDELYDIVTDRLIAAGVIGWFQGRAEFGPRALGNRSILVDPRRADAKELLNRKIKRRESFRPFAPSVLKEYCGEYFEQTDDVPFMEKVFQIRPEKRSIIPAVTHVDGSGRLQTVDSNETPRYYRLIQAFGKKSGVPILLNTSFNENEPIVNTPQEAYDCFFRTKMDMLVMGNVIVER